MKESDVEKKNPADVSTPENKFTSLERHIKEVDCEEKQEVMETQM